MAKKRKRSNPAEAVPKKEEAAPERPARTLLGWKEKDKVSDEVEVKNNDDSTVFFRNKEKVLVTCSRRIVYRYKTIKKW